MSDFTEQNLVEPIDGPLPIVFQDEHYVVVYKPAGLLVHRSWIAKQATVFAMQLLRDQLGQYVYPVHRLDRPTCGLLVMALSSEAAAKLSECFSNREVSKSYVAIVRGYIEGEHHLDYPLVEEQDQMTDALAQQDKDAQPAVTDYRGLALAEISYSTGRFPTSRYSLLRLNPLTGRKHQLRRHMHHISHPIIGDTTHGDGKHNRLFRELGHPGLWLFADQLRFTHPYSGEIVSCKSPLPPRWQRVLEQLSWNSSLLLSD
ncbi:tRNA pseudouridine(65) synthase TruC [Aliagarivorans marinus]|uniref:tRNA pseudouridine(65) synthase TruC n=1 Tax=Aliagarivorans marinus TaxID=561965 RepID=UPI0003F8CD02|nr:tRNA pseudouridine(65) synthase TruC [Aliagarivorans marinus]